MNDVSVCTRSLGLAHLATHAVFGPLLCGTHVILHCIPVDPGHNSNILKNLNKIGVVRRGAPRLRNKQCLLCLQALLAGRRLSVHCRVADSPASLSPMVPALSPSAVATGSVSDPETPHGRQVGNRIHSTDRISESRSVSPYNGLSLPFEALSIYLSPRSRAAPDRKQQTTHT